MGNPVVYYPDPLLKWAGGKRWLISELRKWYDPARRLVDPFTGGMAVPLGLESKNVLMCDVNPHLMNLYMHLRNGLVKEESLDHIKFENDADTYYKNRTAFNELANSKHFWTTEGALLFYYLNKTCFNGLCRFNRGGEFNVPFGKYKIINYRVDFRIYQDVMTTWQLMCGDFESLPIESDDFIYADPPYDVEFTSFAQRDFTWSDQLRLANWLANHKGPAVVSNQATDRIIKLYQSHQFEIYTLPGPRRISANGDRAPAQEMLAVKRI